LPPRRKPEGKLVFHVERGPLFLCVATRGEASFDQAELIAAQVLRVPLDGYSLVVLDLTELTFLSSLAMGALVTYRRDLGRLGVEVGLANDPACVCWRWNRRDLGSCLSP
jgi:anti-anti-sigma regulatory factor